MRKWKMPTKTIFLAMIFSLVMAIPVWAVGIQIQDDAELLDLQAEIELKMELEAAEAETGWDIILLSIADAGGKSAQTYAEDLYDENLVIEDGVTCVIDMDNREIAVQTTGEAIFYLTDARIETILDIGYVSVVNECYQDAYSAMLGEILACYEMGANGNYAYDVDTGKVTTYKSLEWEEILISLVFGLLVTIGIGAAIIAKYRMKFGQYKYNLAEKSHIQLTGKTDNFIRETTTRKRIPRNNGGGGGRSGGGHSSGRSSTHRSSSGRSHGGGSRKF